MFVWGYVACVYIYLYEVWCACANARCVRTPCRFLLTWLFWNAEHSADSAYRARGASGGSHREHSSQVGMRRQGSNSCTVQSAEVSGPCLPEPSGGAAPGTAKSTHRKEVSLQCCTVHIWQGERGCPVRPENLRFVVEDGGVQRVWEEQREGGGCSRQSTSGVCVHVCAFTQGFTYFQFFLIPPPASGVGQTVSFWQGGQ